jgi:hypothetical protein
MTASANSSQLLPKDLIEQATGIIMNCCDLDVAHALQVLRKMSENTSHRRAGVEDRWHRTIRDEHGTTRTVPSATYGTGSRWRARYVDEHGREHAKSFGRKVDAQQWVDEFTAAVVTGKYVDPNAGQITFRDHAERWRGMQV